MKCANLSLDRRRNAASRPFQICVAGALTSGTFLMASHLIGENFASAHGEEMPSITVEAVHLGKADGQNVMVVTSVESDGSAYDAGIHVGDVIKLVNGKPVFSTKQLSSAIVAGSGSSAHFLLVRRSAPVELDLPIKPAHST